MDLSPWKYLPHTGGPVMKRIISTETRRGEAVYLVQEDGERTADILTAEQVDRTRRVDTINLEYGLKARDAMGAADAKRQADKAARENLDGFDAGMTAMQRGRVVAALTKLVLYRGRGISRRDLIRDKVNAGAVVVPRYGSAVLEMPDGASLDQSAITKTGMEYARFLTATRKG